MLVRTGLTYPDDNMKIYMLIITSNDRNTEIYNVTITVTICKRK